MISDSLLAPFCYHLPSLFGSLFFFDKILDVDFVFAFWSKSDPKTKVPKLLRLGVPFHTKNHILEKRDLGRHLRVPWLVLGLISISCLIVLGVKFGTVSWFAVSAAYKKTSLRSGFADLPWLRHWRLA